jgi:hypothetical protein
MATRCMTFERVPDQLDAPARTVQFIAHYLVAWASCRAEAATHTTAQNVDGFGAGSRPLELGRELGLHSLTRCDQAAEIEDMVRIEHGAQALMQCQQLRRQRRES